MADNVGQAKDRVFNAETLDPREYMRWRQWAKARLRRSNLAKEDKGPLLFTFLDGVAQAMFENIDIDAELAVEDGEQVIFDRLDAMYPDLEPADRLSDALEAEYSQRCPEHHPDSQNANQKSHEKHDYDMLKQSGVSAIFGPGTNIPAAASEIIGLVHKRGLQAAE